MLLALPFLIVAGLLLPLLGWLSLRQLRSAGEGVQGMPPVSAVVAQIFVLQSLVAGLAALAAYGTATWPEWLSRVSLLTTALALAVLAIVLFVAVLEARRPLRSDEANRAQMRKISAKDPRWIGVTLYAGAVEEFAYRGVLTLILASLVGYWPAALVSALCFGLGHLSGGMRAAAYSVSFGLLMQCVVYVSGGLLLAVAVHIAYDLCAAWLGQRLPARPAAGSSD